MAMTIMNNTSAMLTLGQLNKNISKVGKELKKVSSGMKLNSAGDDASAFAISEKMRVRIRGLEQDIDNVKKGKSLLEVGAGGIDEIVQELRNLKALAINAANDHNSDNDREVIQKEFDQRMENINDIASTTNYNGKLLLNGDYGRWQKAWVAVDNTEDGTGAGAGAGTGVSEPTGTPTVIKKNIYGPPYTITNPGVYVLEAGFMGTVNIADGLTEGVKIQQATSAPLAEVFINGPSSGEANLWIEGLNIYNTTDQSWIKFYGSDNVLTIKGDNKFNIANSEKANIHIGNGLTIEGDGSLNMKVTCPNGAIIGTDKDENSSAKLTINGGSYTMTSITNGGWGAMIGSGQNGSIGDISINGGTFDLKTIGAGAPLGSGCDGTAGNITVKNVNYNAVSDDGACIGSGCGNSSVGDILIENSTLNVQNGSPAGTLSEEAEQVINNAGCGAGIGSGGYWIEKNEAADAGNITIRNSIVNASSIWGAGIGSGYKSHAGNITLENVEGTITSKYGDNIGKGKDGTIGGVNTDGGSSSGGGITYHEVTVLGNPLVIHTGTKANQALYCYIPNMHTKNMGLDGVSVVTRQKAESSLAKLDKAINYALDAATEVGSYIQRLNACEENLVTNNENTQFSESTIRDVDMAKSMTEYTKSNVLAQASQSMLAQANQTSASVLSLLQ